MLYVVCIVYMLYLVYSMYVWLHLYMLYILCIVYMLYILCMYSCIFSRVWMNRIWLQILLVVSLTWKMLFSLFPFAPENLVSRDRFGRPAPRQQLLILHTQAESFKGIKGVIATDGRNRPTGSSIFSVYPIYFSYDITRAEEPGHGMRGDFWRTF